eukprot:m.272977 g.272977  ORF g.272977 m.272977 type:complete len:770 (+) comp16276_c0_seq41:172-2481(+)
METVPSRRLGLHGIQVQQRGPQSYSYLLVLASGKIFRSYGLTTAYKLSRNTPVLALTSIFLCLASCFCFLIQRTQKGAARISSSQIKHVFFYGAVMLLHTVLFYGGLSLCGPIKTILIAEYGDGAILGLATLMTGSDHVPASRVRGTLLGLLGLLTLFMFDDDAGRHAIAHVEKGTGIVHTDYHTVRHSTHFGWLQFSDSSAGMIAALLCACTNIAMGFQGRRLSAAMGGSRRLHAYGSACAAALSLFTQFFFRLSFPQKFGDLKFLGLIVVCVISLHVLSFYIEKTASSHISPIVLKSVGLLTSFFSAGLFEHLILPRSTLKFHTLLSCFFMVMGQSLYISTPAASSRAVRGELIGYGPDGLPQYSEAESGLPTSTILKHLRSMFRAIVGHTDSRQIFYFLCLNFCFMFVELTVGAWTNSLSLISDAFHMFFDCTALLVGLYASVISKWKPNRGFSFGYGRVEILSGYANGIFLLIVALHIFWEAVKRLHAPPEINTDRLLLVSVGGLVVNLIGIFAFSHAHSHVHAHDCGGAAGHHSHSHESHGHSHGNSKAHSSRDDANSSFALEMGLADENRTPRKQISESKQVTSRERNVHAQRNVNMQGVYLHVMADALGSVGVIVSSLLVENFGIFVADPICSIFISGLIFMSVLPLLKKVSEILLDRVPRHLSEGRLASKLKEIKQLDGVIGYRRVRAWSHGGQGVIASLHVVVLPGSNQQKILNQVVACLKDIGISNLTVQVESQGTRSMNKMSPRDPIEDLGFDDVKSV